MKKKFQVFVSSTYTDLETERLKVFKAILELGHIPTGMEYMPAASDDQWTVIKQIIDECDYYIVVIGGRYGSLTAEGISYTQKEFQYAVDKGIPVMAFIHSNPEEIAYNKSETDEILKEKLERFKSIVKKPRMCQFWKNGDELSSHVKSSLFQVMHDHPRPGWSRLKDYNLASNRYEMWEQWIEAAKHAKSTLSAVTYSVGPNLKDSKELSLCEKFFDIIQNMRANNADCKIYLLVPKKSALNSQKLNVLLWRRRVGFEIKIVQQSHENELHFRYQIIDEEDVVLNLPNIAEVDHYSEMSIRFKDDKIAGKMQRSFNKVWAKSTPFAEFLFKDVLLTHLKKNKPLSFEELKKNINIPDTQDLKWILDCAQGSNKILFANGLYQVR